MSCMLRALGLALLFVALSAAPAGAQADPSPVRAFEFNDADPRTDTHGVVVGENLGVTKLIRESKLFEDNSFERIVGDMFYNPRTRRVHTRSLHLADVDDIVDVRGVRVPGRYPNEINFDAQLPPWTISFQVGASNYRSGTREYYAGAQFITLEDDTGAVCLSTTTDRDRMTRYSGEAKKGGKMVAHLCVFPDGSIVLNFNSDPTDPANPPRVFIEGDLYLKGRVHQMHGNALDYIFPPTSRTLTTIHDLDNLRNLMPMEPNR